MAALRGNGTTNSLPQLDEPVIIGEMPERLIEYARNPLDRQAIADVYFGLQYSHQIWLMKRSFPRSNE